MEEPVLSLLDELNGVDLFLFSPYSFMNLVMVEKCKFFLGYHPRKDGIDADSNDLRDDFIYAVT